MRISFNVYPYVTFYGLICLFFFGLSLTAFAQQTDVQQEKPGRLPASYHLLKIGIYPKLPTIAIKPLHLQYEKAFAGNPKFTGIIAAMTDIRSHSFDLGEFTFKIGPRYYIRHNKENVYNGFFAGLAPMYNWQNIDGFRKQHSLALDAMAGYQKIIKRISVEANMSVAYGGGWYQYDEFRSYENQQGFHSQVFVNGQINIGYMF